ncbi:histidine phosphatase family protein [Pseudonocardia broussonetiae]|uniref:Histidine phosphatase family protein n=1 Tax=Pseudonocardia broussonetiae TaxID=2736640 RepID=A0A6M6JGV9_9PSEU|nr:histidine phosphatase family protein [Pseudonocardia broussonetiae]QJY45619.1 histidine phosphatase family protein [Pseudonocardia broussonetiae]
MRLVLVRHAECLGNVDKSAYTRIPDHALPLTPAGERQAREAGPRLRGLLGDGPYGVVVSPYRRTLHSLALFGLDPVATVQEPRLREQDWGNLQDDDGQRRQEAERHAYGHFFYRLAHGESGADVDDRIAAFLGELDLRPPGVDALLLVTHGLTMRLLARRAMGWSVSLFESLSNPACCEDRVLTRGADGWTLDRPFAQWRAADDGSVQ